MMRMNGARSPALMPQEAAMLPAQSAEQTIPRQGRLLMPRREEDFVPVQAEAAQPASIRRGSAAGRAILRAAGISMPGVGSMSRGW